eukprot:2204646-Rhodomonas_salina.4
MSNSTCGCLAQSRFKIQLAHATCCKKAKKEVREVKDAEQTAKKTVKQISKPSNTSDVWLPGSGTN